MAGSSDQRPTVSLADLSRLQDQINKPQPLTLDEVHDFAVAALVVIRGMPKRDRLRVIKKMLALVNLRA